MTEQVPHELVQLRAIEEQVQAIQSSINERLPNTRRQMLAIICARKWQFDALIQPHKATAHERIDDIVKHLRREIAVYDYRVREQAELLTRHLCELDNILSNGNVEVRDTRKALVIKIQSILSNADTLKELSTQLKNFFERTVTFISVLSSEPENAQQDDPMDEQTKADDIEEDETCSSTSDDEEDNQEDEDEQSDDEMETDVNTVNNQDDTEPVADDEEADKNDDDMEDEAVNIKMPMWTPYYQLQWRGDGVYLTTRLQGVDSSHINVSCSPQSGLITISGIKYPTHKDLILTQFTGTPTFGRFKIMKRIDTNLVNVEDATQQRYSDGTLMIRLPFYTHQPHMFVRPVGSLYKPTRRCVVW